LFPEWIGSGGWNRTIWSTFPIAGTGVRYFDLYHGVELEPELEGDTAVLSFPLEAHGYGAVFAAQGEPGTDIRKLLATMKTMTAAPLSSYSNEWKTLPQMIVDILPTKPASAAPVGMVKITGGDYVFKVEGIEIEASDDIGVDVQYPWEDMPLRFHEHRMQIKPFYMDKYLVTNAAFKKFLDATRYHPSDDLNFLRDWKDGEYPDGWGQQARYLGVARGCAPTYQKRQIP
jgi:hypothetical protein